MIKIGIVDINEYIYAYVLHVHMHLHLSIYI